MPGSKRNTSPFLLAKAVRYKKGAVLFLEELIFEEDIFWSSYWIRNCFAMRKVTECFHFTRGGRPRGPELDLAWDVCVCIKGGGEHCRNSCTNAS